MQRYLLLFVYMYLKNFNFQQKYDDPTERKNLLEKKLVVVVVVVVVVTYTHTHTHTCIYIYTTYVVTK